MTSITAVLQSKESRESKKKPGERFNVLAFDNYGGKVFDWNGIANNWTIGAAYQVEIEDGQYPKLQAGYALHGQAAFQPQAEGQPPPTLGQRMVGNYPPPQPRIGWDSMHADDLREVRRSKSAWLSNLMAAAISSGRELVPSELELWSECYDAAVLQMSWPRPKRLHQARPEPDPEQMDQHAHEDNPDIPF